MGEIQAASGQVSEFCGKNFPCAGELDKVTADATAIKQQATDLESTESASSGSSGSASSSGDGSAAASTTTNSGWVIQTE